MGDRADRVGVVDRGVRWDRSDIDLTDSDTYRVTPRNGVLTYTTAAQSLINGALVTADGGRSTA